MWSMWSILKPVLNKVASDLTPAKAALIVVGLFIGLGLLYWLMAMLIKPVLVIVALCAVYKYVLKPYLTGKKSKSSSSDF